VDGEAPRKKTSGAVKLLLFGGLGCLVVVVGLAGTCTWFLATNPEVRKVGALVGETMKLGLSGARAPGTEQLREAGCDQAFVMDMRALSEMMKELDDEGDIEMQGGDLEQVVVVCHTSQEPPPLECDKVATVYAGAVDNPPPTFGVSVQAGFRRRQVCQGIFRPNGTRVGELTEDTPPPPLPPPLPSLDGTPTP